MSQLYTVHELVDSLLEGISKSGNTCIRPPSYGGHRLRMYSAPAEAKSRKEAVEQTKQTQCICTLQSDGSIQAFRSSTSNIHAS